MGQTGDVTTPPLWGEMGSLPLTEPRASRSAWESGPGLRPNSPGAELALLRSSTCPRTL